MNKYVLFWRLQVLFGLYKPCQPCPLELGEAYEVKYLVNALKKEIEEPDCVIVSHKEKNGLLWITEKNEYGSFTYPVAAISTASGHSWKEHA